jgi:hypothetical protein
MIRNHIKVSSKAPFGGFRLSRKRWLSMLDESILIGPKSFAAQTWMLGYTRKYLKAYAFAVRCLDPSGFSVALPPFRTLDTFVWRPSEDGEIPLFEPRF